MTKKIIKKLVLASYNDNNLDISKINKIVKLLKRKEFNSYLKALKNKEKSKTITIYLSDISGKSDLLSDIKNIYPDKNIIIKEDKNLIGGIKIIDNDTIYDANIKNNLDSMINYINEKYAN